MAITINSSDILQIHQLSNHLKIFAGPGAGKTHLIIENIKNIIAKSQKLRTNGRKILCITYTNAAANEIVKRLGNYNEFVYVSTIHSFIYDQIIKDNQPQLRLIIKDKFNMELQNTYKINPRKEGFRLLSKDDEIAIRAFIESESGAALQASSRTKIEECIIDISEINAFPFNENGVASINGSFGETTNFWIKYGIWSKARVIDFDEILYFGYELVRKYKHISYNLQFRFPFVFIDEYQDTNPLQNALIKIFADSPQCIMGVIGDVAQSIYSFQGADYREFENYQMKKRQINEYVIQGNRRSTQNIIHFVNFLRQKDVDLPAQTCEKNKTTDSKVKIIILNQTDNILDKLPQDIVILCRLWAEVFQYIPNLSPAQQKLTKDIQNYYTYQFHRDFTTEIEQERIDWIKIAAYIVKVKDAIFHNNMAKTIEISSNFFDTDLFLSKNNNQAKNYQKFFRFVKNVSSIEKTLTFAEILLKINTWLSEINLTPIESFRIASSEADEYYDKKLYDWINQIEYFTLEKMILEVFSKTSKFMTIHKSKGQEFNNVLVNIAPSRNDLDGKTLTSLFTEPYVFSMDNNISNSYEYTRIVYVGASRAINNLYICLDSTKIDVNLFINALENYASVKQIAEPFWEVVK